MAFLTEAANRGSISTGYDIDNSLKFEPDNSEYLKSNTTHAYTSPTSNQKGTVSFWIKRTEIGNGVSGKQMYIFASANSARYSNLGFDEFDNLTIFSGDSSWNSVSPYTYNKFRDTSAWFHIVIRYDTTDSTASNRLRVYSNGTEVSWVTAPNITQDGVMTYSGMNGPCWHSWGTIYSYFTPAKFFSGYLAEAHFVDGQSLAPTEFGEVDDDSGIWKPKEYDGTYGNCGYYLDFADSGNLGDDESGNGFDFDENNIAAADQATDTPTNNFATMTEVWAYASQLEVRWGGTLTTTNTAAWSGAKSTIGVNKGKWYWEIRWNDTISTYTGIQTQGEDNISASGSAAHSRNTSLSIGAGSKYRTYINGTDTLYTSQPSGNISTGEVTGFALDLDSGTKTLKLIRSGSVVQTYTLTDSLATEYVFPFCSTYAQTLVWNLGGFFHYTLSSAETDANGLGSFEFSPTIGGVNYYALCTKNLAEYG